MADRYKVLVLNQISQHGLKRLPAELYEVGKDLAEPDAVLVRSADMHAMQIPSTVRAIVSARVRCAAESSSSRARISAAVASRKRRGQSTRPNRVGSAPRKMFCTAATLPIVNRALV